MAKVGRILLAAGSALTLGSAPALAGDLPADLTDCTLPPVISPLAVFSGAMGADASGALYDAHQDGGINRAGATGSLLIEPSLETVLDNAWGRGFRGAILAYH